MIRAYVLLILILMMMICSQPTRVCVLVCVCEIVRTYVVIVAQTYVRRTTYCS